MEVLDFIEEEDLTALDSEEKVFDEHVNRVSDIMERLEKLEELVATTHPVRPHASTDRSGSCQRVDEESETAQVPEN